MTIHNTHYAIQHKWKAEHKYEVTVQALQSSGCSTKPEKAWQMQTQDYSNM